MFYFQNSISVNLTNSLRQLKSRQVIDLIGNRKNNNFHFLSFVKTTSRII